MVGDCPNFRVSENGTVPFDARKGPLTRKSMQAPWRLEIAPARVRKTPTATRLVGFGQNLLRYVGEHRANSPYGKCARSGTSKQNILAIFVAYRGMAMDPAKDGKVAAEQKSGYKDRPWIPRFWDGMCIRGWFSLLARNRFAISPSRIGMALVIGISGFINFVLWLLQAVLLGWRIRRTKIEQDPIFVIGHWRSGTTLLHELLVRDPRHTFPDTYACFAPNHFLASGWMVRPCLQFLLPPRRPMDNMAAGWSHPQEDEFALCNMGVRSPYLTIIFPNHPPQDQEYLDFRGVPGPALECWRRAFLWFLKCVTFRSPKRIVLKSPPHTARCGCCWRCFPRRSSSTSFATRTSSFLRRSICGSGSTATKACRCRTCEGLEDHVFDTLTRMYEAFDRDRSLIGPGQFCEIRYEDLIADPVGQMRSIYDRLELGDFEAVRPEIEKYVAGQKDYKTNRYQITPEMRAEVARRWGKYLKDYGYAADGVGSKQPAAVSRPTTVGT